MIAELRARQTFDVAAFREVLAIARRKYRRSSGTSQGRSLTRKTLNAEQPFTRFTTKEKAQGFEPVRERVVCAMKCGGAPSQPADNHQTSRRHVRFRPDDGPPVIIHLNSRPLTVVWQGSNVGFNDSLERIGRNRVRDRLKIGRLVPSTNLPFFGNAEHPVEHCREKTSWARRNVNGTFFTNLCPVVIRSDWLGPFRGRQQYLHRVAQKFSYWPSAKSLARTRTVRSAGGKAGAICAQVRRFRQLHCSPPWWF